MKTLCFDLESENIFFVAKGKTFYLPHKMVAHIANQYYDQESIGKSARDVRNLIPFLVFAEKMLTNFVLSLTSPFYSIPANKSFSSYYFIQLICINTKGEELELIKSLPFVHQQHK